MSQMHDDTDPAEGEDYHGYSIDDEDQLAAEDQLLDGPASDIEDELDRGYSPPEHWSPGQGYGNTPYEEATGESFEQRLRQEEPEPDVDPEAVADEAPRAEDEADGVGPEVGDARAGRLVDPDRGGGTDREKDLVADDVGIDGAAASAEEAAVHVLEEGRGPSET